ncbi:hypothetical protein D3C72_1592880 [compost metagenome]
MRDHILQGFERRACQHGDAEGLARGAGKIGQFVAGIELQHSKLGKARHRNRNLPDGVAVGLGLRQGLGADHAGGARAVFDHDGLPEHLGRDLAKRSHGLIRRAADRPGADERDGPRRIVGGARGVRSQQGGGAGTGHAGQQPAPLRIRGRGVLHGFVSGYRFFRIRRIGYWRTVLILMGLYITI